MNNQAARALDRILGKLGFRSGLPDLLRSITTFISDFDKTLPGKGLITFVELWEKSLGIVNTMVVTLGILAAKITALAAGGFLRILATGTGGRLADAARTGVAGGIAGGGTVRGTGQGSFTIDRNLNTGAARSFVKNLNLMDGAVIAAIAGISSLAAVVLPLAIVFGRLPEILNSFEDAFNRFVRGLNFLGIEILEQTDRGKKEERLQREISRLEREFARATLAVRKFFSARAGGDLNVNVRGLDIEGVRALDEETLKLVTVTQKLKENYEEIEEFAREAGRVPPERLRGFERELGFQRQVLSLLEEQKGIVSELEEQRRRGISQLIAEQGRVKSIFDEYRKNLRDNLIERGSESALARLDEIRRIIDAQGAVGVDLQKATQDAQDRLLRSGAPTDAAQYLFGDAEQAAAERQIALIREAITLIERLASTSRVTSLERQIASQTLLEALQNELNIIGQLEQITAPNKGTAERRKQLQGLIDDLNKVNEAVKLEGLEGNNAALAKLFIDQSKAAEKMRKEIEASKKELEEGGIKPGGIDQRIRSLFSKDIRNEFRRTIRVLTAANEALKKLQGGEIKDERGQRSLARNALNALSVQEAALVQLQEIFPDEEQFDTALQGVRELKEAFAGLGLELDAKIPQKEFGQLADNLGGLVREFQALERASAKGFSLVKKD